jgi:hypothetical protein
MTPSPQHAWPPRSTGDRGPAGLVDQNSAENADRLWAALARARTGDLPRTRAHTEDAVFRFYLPLARTLAQASPRYRRDPHGAEQTAEVGLAQAVLAWRHSNSSGFAQAARTAINNHLQRTHGPTTRRRYQNSPLPPRRNGDQPLDE